MIGTYIRQLREERGYLLRQMSALLDVDPTILSKMERGERPFKRDNILKVAEVCGINKDELLKQWLADKIAQVIDGEELGMDAVELVMKLK